MKRANKPVQLKNGNENKQTKNQPKQKTRGLENKKIVNRFIDWNILV